MAMTEKEFWEVIEKFGLGKKEKGGYENLLYSFCLFCHYTARLYELEGMKQEYIDKYEHRSENIAEYMNNRWEKLKEGK